MADTDPVPRTDDIMRRLSSDNPKSREHREEYADGRSFWRCIPIRDAVEVRQSAIEAEARGEWDVPLLVADVDAALDAFDPASPDWPDFGKSLVRLKALRRLRAALARQADHE